MSGQPPQRVRRIASPSTKQGPIKAVKPFTLMHGSPTRSISRNSPSSSPTSILTSDTHRIKSHRRSPDSRSSPERRSPNSPSFKVERPKAVRLSPASTSGLRRTGSLDTLRTGSLDAVGPYLTGQWPKDKTSVTSYHHYQAAGLLSCDKSTQTPDDWELPATNEGKKKGHKRSASLGNGDQLKEFRQRLQRGSKQSESTKQRQSPIPGNHLALSTAPPSNYMPSKAIVIPIHIPKSNGPRAYPRNSVEGLNPEIENLTISSGDEPDEKITDNIFLQDGRRAPGPEVCRGSSTRSIDTQTPSQYVDEGATSSSGSRSQSVSPALPIMPAGPMDSSRPSSVGDSLDTCTPAASRDAEVKVEEKVCESEVSPESPDVSSQSKAASPMPNKSCSFVREPPDGCEKVKAIDEKERPRIKEPLLFHPVKSNQFVLRQSAGSAFSPAALKETYSSIMSMPSHASHLAVKSPGLQSTTPQTSIESQ